MPKGKPNFPALVSYPTIACLEAENGRKTMLKAIYLLVLDFCKSLNVTRNMADDQIIEAAIMLLDQCGNYRLEDYAVMFTMAKRGQFDIKLYEGLDVLKISEIEKAYDEYSSKQLQIIKDAAWQALDEKGEALRKEQSAKKFCQEYGYDYEISKENLFKEVEPERVAQLLSAFGEQWQRELVRGQDKETAERISAREKQQEAQIYQYCQHHGLDYEVAKNDWKIIREDAARRLSELKRRAA